MTDTTTPTTTAQIAARIGARIRAHLRDPAWSWRWTTTTTDEADVRAIARLRDDAARACRYLTMATDHIGLPLPRGNGTDGPWQRQAVLDERGLLGIADIAAGRVAWTDTVVPSYVRRFAVRRDRAVSPHGAGGSGAMGRAVAQIALVYTDDLGRRRRPVLSPLPRPRVTTVEYGLTTCYGTIGDAPSATEYRTEWAALAQVPSAATAQPQWESWQPPGGLMSGDHARALLGALPYISARIEVREGGVRGTAEYRVRGTAAQRAEAIRSLQAAHPIYAAAALRAADYRARIALGLGGAEPVEDVRADIALACRATRTGDLASRAP